MKSSVLLMLILCFVSCRPDQEETDFEQMELSELSSEGEGLSCESLEDFDSCIDSPMCQPVYEPNDTTFYGFISCTGYADDLVEEPSEEEYIADPNEEILDDSLQDVPVIVGDNPPNIEGEDSDENSEENSDEEIDYAAIACKVNRSGQVQKIKICHVPYGNPANAHVQCVALQGWLNGLGPQHDGINYLGNCRRPE